MLKNLNDLRVIVAGGREFNNFDRLCKFCDSVINGFKTKDTIVTIISGNAIGTDRMGEQYAQLRGYNLKIIPADWFKLGRSAGIIRNKQMAEYAISDNANGILIAFWNGASRGTGNMIQIARTNRMDVFIDTCDYKKKENN